MSRAKVNYSWVVAGNSDLLYRADDVTGTQGEVKDGLDLLQLATELNWTESRGIGKMNKEEAFVHIWNNTYEITRKLELGSCLTVCSKMWN